MSAHAVQLYVTCLHSLSQRTCRYRVYFRGRGCQMSSEEMEMEYIEYIEYIEVEVI